MLDRSISSQPGGLRALLNRHRFAVAAGALLLLVIGLAVTILQGDPPEQGGYYSTDDGQTFFQSPRKIPPFDYRGSEAVGAVVYSCDGGTTRKVAYLQKFTPAGKQKAEANDRAKRAGPPGGLLLKRPGSGRWIAADDPANFKAASEIRGVHCPDGRSPTLYLP